MQIWQFDSGEIGKRSFQFVGQADTELNECLKIPLFFSGFCVESVLKVRGMILKFAGLPEPISSIQLMKLEIVLCL